jgi:hypothetical protein
MMHPSEARFTTGELWGALYLLGCANGLGARIISSVRQHGWADAAAGTFDVSVIVVGACVIGISLVLTEQRRPGWLDVSIALILSILIALPIGAFSWVGVTLLSLYLLATAGPKAEPQRRGAVILLAATVPVLWSRLVFDLFANFILGVDAALVSRILGTQRTGNMVQFADNSGTLVIFSSCSSLANVSLALLCWVTVSQAVQHRRRAQDAFWCLLACCSVIAVNVLRISIMGLSSAHYQVLHSEPAQILLNVIILALVLSISIAGTRRDLFSRA